MNEPSKTIKKLAKAIYSNKLFQANFAPQDPEIFPGTNEIHARDIDNQYSEFEAELLLEKFNWFRNLENIRLLKTEQDPSQRKGYDLMLKGKFIGFIEQWPEFFRLGFVVNSDNENGFEWKWLRKTFETLDEAKTYLKIYNGTIQDKYDFYFEKVEIPEIKNKEDVEDDYN